MKKVLPIAVSALMFTAIIVAGVIQEKSREVTAWKAAAENARYYPKVTNPHAGKGPVTVRTPQELELALKQK